MIPCKCCIQDRSVRFYVKSIFIHKKPQNVSVWDFQDFLSFWVCHFTLKFLDFLNSSLEKVQNIHKNQYSDFRARLNSLNLLKQQILRLWFHVKSKWQKKFAFFHTVSWQHWFCSTINYFRKRLIQSSCKLLKGRIRGMKGDTWRQNPEKKYLILWHSSCSALFHKMVIFSELTCWFYRQQNKELIHTQLVDESAKKC